MAKSRTLPPVAGGYSYQTPTGPLITFNRDKADSGLERVTIENTAGDHVTVNAFTMLRSQVSGGMVSGKRGYYSASSAYPSRAYDHVRASMPALPPTPGGLANKLFANASPDRPEILAPVFLFELRELPELIKSLGLFNFGLRPNRTNADKTAAKIWLSGNFGWAPLINDLKKLVEFPDAFARREKEIDDLHATGKGLRRKVNLYSYTGPEVALTINCDSPDASLGTVIATGAPTVHIWGTVRYRPAKLPDGSPLRKPTPQDLRRRILGLNAASITLNIWEALPWSWLVDYFVGVGDYLGANPMGRTAIPYGGCIMEHRRCEWNAAGKAGPRDANGDCFVISATRVLSESKNRIIAYPGTTPTVLMNPLTGHQLSILGALKTLGARRTVRY